MGTVPLKYGAEWGGSHYNVFVSVHHADGSISISHAGIEIGQGINTKVRILFFPKLKRVLPMSLLNVEIYCNLVC